MLGVDVPPPRRFRRGKGFWRAGGSLVGDVPGWRALAFLVVSFPAVVGGFVVSVTFLAVGLGGLTYPIWYRFLPLQQAADGGWHRGAQYGTDWFVDTPSRIAAQAAAALVVLFCWPYVTRAVTHLTRLLIVNLLGPTRSSERVAALERSRGHAVQDADARLRRVASRCAMRWLDRVGPSSARVSIRNRWAMAIVTRCHTSSATTPRATRASCRGTVSMK
jgi:hypothetical protein